MYTVMIWHKEQSRNKVMQWYNDFVFQSISIIYNSGSSWSFHGFSLSSYRLLRLQVFPQKTFSGESCVVEARTHQTIKPPALVGPAFTSGSIFLRVKGYPIASMGLVYLPIHEWLIDMVNVGKYTIHGCYEYCSFGMFFAISKRNLKIPFRYNHTTYLFPNLQYNWGYPRYQMSSFWDTSSVHQSNFSRAKLPFPGRPICNLKGLTSVVLCLRWEPRLTSLT